MSHAPDIAASRPRVSVVVVTLNNRLMLHSSLQSLLDQDYPDLDIIVVDNGSTEDIVGMVRREFPGVRLIRLDHNTGFAGGNNRGIEQATGDYVALLNNDAVADATWISALVRAAEEDPHVGAVGSAVIDGHAPDRLDSFGVGVALDGMSRQAMHGLPVSMLPREIRPALAVSGCACLFRMATLRETGLFDEAFFAYCEDTDLSLRLCRAGWNIVLSPEARVTHRYSQTAGAFSLQKVFWVERNHYWVAAKNFPPLWLLAMPGVTLWRYLVQSYAVATGAGSLHNFFPHGQKGALIGRLFFAQVAAMAGLPANMVARATFRPPVRRSSLDMFRLLWRFRISIYEVITGMGTAAPVSLDTMPS